MMESKVEMVESSVNVLWLNLIALNTSLYKENEEKNQQLIELKKKLLEEEEKSTKLRSAVERYQQDVMHKSQRIVQLTSKLKAVRQLTEDDCIEMGHVLVEKDENRPVKSTPITHIGNEISSQRKISHFFQNGCIDTETKPLVKENYESSLNRINGRDGQENKDENLLIPLLVVDKSKKPKVCNECGRHFKNTTILKRHQMIHTGLRPFVCQECSKAFARSDNFKNHMRLHTGLRPFVCQECSKAFARSDHFKNHMRLHLQRNVSGSRKHFKKNSSGSKKQLKESNSVSSSDKQLNESNSVSSSDKQLNESSSMSSSDKQLNESSSVSGSKQQLNESSSMSGSKQQLNESSEMSGSKKKLNKRRIFKCDVCDLKYIHKNILWRHKKQVHAK